MQIRVGATLASAARPFLVNAFYPLGRGRAPAAALLAYLPEGRISRIVNFA